MKTLLISVLIAVLGSSAIAATNTVSYSDMHKVKTVTFNVSSLNILTHHPAAPTNDQVASVSTKIISGQVLRLAVSASAVSGTTFSVMLKDSDGVDLLNGTGMLMPTAPASICVTNIGSWYQAPAFESALTLVVTNFANPALTNTAQIKLYYTE